MAFVSKKKTRRGAALAALGVVVACSVACATTTGARVPAASALAPPRPPRPPTLRLPRVARPTSYDLYVEVAPERETIRGEVTIHLAVATPTNILWLHAKGLGIDAAALSLEDGEKRAQVVVGDDDFVGLSFDERIPRGTATLKVAYTGKLDPSQPRGMYRHSEAGRAYAYTMFEPTDARRAFPCFDEPEYKVPWRITLRVPETHEALSNMRASAVRSLGDGTKIVTFAETPALPSYLIALAVGPFELVDGGQVGRRRVPFRIAVQRGRAAELSYARTSLPKMVDLLEDFVGSPYPYDHLDVLVTPGRWGTVEYPGLLALGQALMLMRPEEETLLRKRELANVAIHELAHYWFGDVVTIGWWSETWIKESTAKWVDFKVTDRFEPSWRYGERVARNVARALEADALPSAGPVHRPVRSPDDILAAYDGPITYAKGAAILEMVAAWVGERHVRDGLAAFVRRHDGGVATTEDYLRALAHGKPEVADVITSFVEQPGVPVVAAALRCAPGEPPRLELSQRPYVALPFAAEAPGRSWSVPICFGYDERGRVQRACTLLREDRAVVPLSATGCPRLVSINPEGLGYYVSAYDETWWRELADAAPSALTPTERRRVLTDAGLLVDAGVLPLGRLLPVVSKWVKQGDADAELLELSLDLLRRGAAGPVDGAARAAYERFLFETYGEWARRSGLRGAPDETPALAQLRLRLVRLLAARDPELLGAARAIAAAWMQGSRNGSTDPATGEAALAAVVASGDQEAFAAALREVERTGDARRQARLLRALGHTRDPQLLSLALPWLVKGNVNVEDAFPLLTQALETAETSAVAYTFLKEHFDELAARFTDQRLFVLLAALERLCDRERREEAAVFVTSRLGTRHGALGALQRSLERAQRCGAVSARNRDAFTASLRR